MTTIPVAKCRFCDNKFKRFYLKKEQFWMAFLKSAWNSKHSEKKEEYPSLITTEIIESERDVYLSV